MPVKWVIDYLLVKWLGKDTVTPLAVDGKGGKAELLEKVARWVAASGRNITLPGRLAMRYPGSVSWTDSPTSLVMIVSYETLRTLTVHLTNCKIGLLLCDEGHRLKNSGIRIRNFFFPLSCSHKALNAPRIAYIPGTELS